MDIECDPPQRIQDVAYKILKGLTNQQFRLVAIIVKSGKIMAISTNNPWKSSPAIHKLNAKKNSHAEFLVLKKVSPEKLKGSILYVFRLLNCKIQFAMGKPCQECQHFIKGLEIKRVIYSNSFGKFETMKV